jgi:hypothetical protein
MGPERRPRRHRRRRDAAVRAHRSPPPPNGGGATLTDEWSVGMGWGAALSDDRETCPPPDLARSWALARGSSPVRGRKKPAPPAQTLDLSGRTVRVALMLGNPRGSSRRSRMAKAEAAIVSKHEGVCTVVATCTMTLTTTATRLTHTHSSSRNRPPRHARSLQNVWPPGHSAFTKCSCATQVSAASHDLSRALETSFAGAASAPLDEPHNDEL